MVVIITSGNRYIFYFLVNRRQVSMIHHQIVLDPTIFYGNVQLLHNVLQVNRSLPGTNVVIIMIMIIVIMWWRMFRIQERSNLLRSSVTRVHHVSCLVIYIDANLE